MSLLKIYNGLRQNYRDSEKRRSDAIFWLYPLYRTCSFPLAAVFIRWGLSANTVTGLGVFVFAASFFAFIYGTPASLMLGTGLYVTSFLFDFADGTVARYHGRPNAFGKLIDGLADSVCFSVFIAVAVGNTAAGFNLLPAQVEIALATAAVLAALLMQNYEFRVIHLLREAGALESNAAAVAAPQRGLMQLLNAFYRNAITVTPLLLLILTPLNLLSLAIIIFFLVHVGMGIPKMVFGILSTRKKLTSVYRAT